MQVLVWSGEAGWPGRESCATRAGEELPAQAHDKDFSLHNQLVQCNALKECKLGRSQ